MSCSMSSHQAYTRFSTVHRLLPGVDSCGLNMFSTTPAVSWSGLLHISVENTRGLAFMACSTPRVFRPFFKSENITLHSTTAQPNVSCDVICKYNYQTYSVTHNRVQTQSIHIDSNIITLKVLADWPSTNVNDKYFTLQI